MPHDRAAVGPHRVAPWGLDLHDVSPVIRQDHGRHGTGDPGGGVHHSDSFERSWHHAPPRYSAVAQPTRPSRDVTVENPVPPARRLATPHGPGDLRATSGRSPGDLRAISGRPFDQADGGRNRSMVNCSPSRQAASLATGS